MNSVFTEIKKLSLEQPIEVDTFNHDRYTVTIRGTDQTKTMYSFGVPIYNEQTNNIVDMKYLHRRTESSYMGSNARITIRDFVKMQNQYGCFDIILPGKISKKTENTISWLSQETQIDATPTLNGMTFKVMCASTDRFNITIKTDRIFQSTRSNDKYFSIMREKFVPFITVSCIGILNDRGDVIAPCEIHNQKVNEKEYFLSFTNQSKSGKIIFFEINMQETKLFQDTTVESRHPQMNNSFGGIAFLGRTDELGEQWLYTRPNFSELGVLSEQKIERVLFHIPIFGGCADGVDVLVPERRFCSFGSTWDKKIQPSPKILHAEHHGRYLTIDATDAFTDPVTHTLAYNEGLILRKRSGDEKCIAISTGDCYLAPQILEIKIKKEEGRT